MLDKIDQDRTVTYSARSREVRCGGIVVALPPVQAVIFGVVFDHWQQGPDGYLSSATISARAGYRGSRQALRINVKLMERRIAALGLRIATTGARCGGYRLVVSA